MASRKNIKNSSRRVSMRRKRKMRALVVLGTAAFLAVFGGSYAALRNYVEKTPEDVICDNIYIGTLEVSGMTKEEAEEALRTQMETDESRTVSLGLRDEKIEGFLKEFGYDSPDIEKLAEKAVRYGKKGNMWKRYRQMKKLEEEAYVLEEEYTVDQEMFSQFCEEKAAPLLQEPENAYITRNSDGTTEITEEKKGETIDVKTTVENLVDYLNDSWEHEDFDMELVVETQAPEIVAEDLEDLTDALGSYYTDAGGGERWTNLKTGVEKLNGILLQPGEELSVYDTTAPYDEEHGYVEGTAYENGQVVPSYGGGICQVSTTLYNAAIYAELEIVERYPHSMTVDYVEPSRDAAIAGGYMDFRFKNPYDDPIYIFGEIDDSNLLRVVIYGKETRPKDRSVEFESETLSTEEYAVTYKANSDLSFGEMQYTGNPHTGREARLWKVVYEDGKEVSREVFNTSTYEKSDEVIEIGTAGGSASAVSALESAIAEQDIDAINSVISAGSGSTEDDEETEG